MSFEQLAVSSERHPKLARKLFPSSDSSSQYDDDYWKPDSKDDSRTSDAGDASVVAVTVCPAPIARLESLDELETNQVENNNKKLEMFYLNAIEQLFLFVEQLDQLEVCLHYSRLLTGIPILALFQKLRSNSNKTSLPQNYEHK